MRGVNYGPNEVEEALVKILMAGEPESRQAEAEQTAREVVDHFVLQIKDMADPEDLNRVGNPYQAACQLISLWAHEADVDRRNNN